MSPGAVAKGCPEALWARGRGPRVGCKGCGQVLGPRDRVPWAVARPWGPGAEPWRRGPQKATESKANLKADKGYWKSRRLRFWHRYGYLSQQPSCSLRAASLQPSCSQQQPRSLLAASFAAYLQPAASVHPPCSLLAASSVRAASLQPTCSQQPPCSLLAA